MATDEQYQELLRLLQALTERVYKLEKAAGLVQTTRSHSQPLPPEKTPPSTSATDSKDELESKIGGQWLNRIGMLAVLIGVSYFLKYAFDNEWVGPAGRVIVGLMAGLGVVFWSEHVRRSGYSAFSYSLKAIGIGVLYLSLWASSELYQLIPTSLAFVAMTTVTAATVAIALWQEAEIIAAFAAMGAFLTPVALSTGENNAASLFTYIAILDAGALVLARYWPWFRVLMGSYLGSLVLYMLWHGRYYTNEQFSTALAAISVIFAIFALPPFVAARSRDLTGMALLALVNAAIFFYQVWDLFEHSGTVRDSAIAAVALGLVYFVAADRLTGHASSVVAYMHAAIGAVFLIIAVPIGLNARWITTAWLVEGGASIEAGRRSGNAFLRYLGVTAAALGILRLLVLDSFSVSRLLMNERMATYALAVAICVYAARFWPASAREYRLAVGMWIVTINVLALVALNLEITDAFTGVPRNFAYSALWMTYGAGLMVAGFWKNSRFLRWQALLLIAVTIAKVFLYDIAALDRAYRILSLIALGLILLATSFMYQHNWFKLRER